MPSRRLAIVTGAGGGIGLEVSRRLSARGFNVIAVERTAELAERACAAIAGTSIAVACDTSDPAQVQALCDRIGGEWSADLELLICNAGVIVPGDVSATTHESIDLQMSVMLLSAQHLIAAAVPVLLKRGGGHILATVSMGGILALPGSAVYSAAKAGLRAYLAALYAELRNTDVAVSGIYPSAVDTPMLRHEATHGGSLLNFVGKVFSASEIADAYERALDDKKLEVYVPYSDSVSTRFVESFPWLVPVLLPALEKIGRRGLARYLASLGSS
jgi:short-subunit dehydrogenase